MHECQIVLMILLGFSLLRMIYIDINGRESKPATGFAGVLGTFVIFALILTLFYFCGAFSTVIK
jgi:hypothetical protein